MAGTWILCHLCSTNRIGMRLRKRLNLCKCTVGSGHTGQGGWAAMQKPLPTSSPTSSPRSPQPGAQGPPGQPGHGGDPPLLDRCWSKWRPPQANMHSHCSPISILPHNCIPYSRNIFASLIPAINLQSLLAQYICIPYSRNIVALPFLAIYLHSLFS